jgi:hypothetical protein
MNIGN